MANNKFIGQIKEFSRYGNNNSGNTLMEEIKLDLIDRKILYLLSENARISYTFLAKKLKKKRETIAYRIKRMEGSDFLHGYLTLLNHRKLGLKNYMVYLKLKTFINEKDMLDYLITIDKVTRLKSCSGNYDLQIIFSVNSEEEFSDLFEVIFDKFNAVINYYDIFEILEEDFMGLNMLLEKEEIKNLSSIEVKGSTFQKEFEKYNTFTLVLDKMDQQILEILKLRANITIAELSTQVTLSPIAVENRIKKLILCGVIKRFVPLASLSMLGYQWWKVFFKFKKIDKQKFFTYLKFHSNVLWCMKLIGKWDFQVSVFAKNNAEFHNILDEIRTEFANDIISYDSIIVFNQLKYNQRVM